MEKKLYEKPSIEVVMLKIQQLMEVASPAGEPDTPVGSRERSSWSDEE